MIVRNRHDSTNWILCCVQRAKHNPAIRYSGDSILVESDGKNVAGRLVQNGVFGEIDENSDTMSFATAEDDKIYTLFLRYPNNFRFDAASCDYLLALPKSKAFG